MNSCRLEDWLGALRLTFQSLHRDGSPVALVGYCLGGTLALAAARELNPRGVVCLSAPIEPLEKKFFPEAQGDGDDLLSTEPFITDCLSGTARRWRMASCHQTVTRQFLQSYQDSIQAAASQLAEIRCPVSLVQGGRSTVVSDSHATYISKRANRTNVTVHFSENAGHAVPIDYGRRQVAKRVAEFLVGIESSERSRF
jgi:esterase/lipase